MSTRNPKITDEIHLDELPDAVVTESLGELICGDDGPLYRSGSMLTRFFQGLDIDITHDGSTRLWWTVEALKQLNYGEIERVILRLVDLRIYKGDREQLKEALGKMNGILAMEDLKIGFSGSTPILRRSETMDLGEEFENMTPNPSSEEQDFLSRRYSDDIDIADLSLDPELTKVLQSRVEEVLAAPLDAMPLGCIFLLGSTLEGLLLAIAMDDQVKFMSSPSAPKFRGTTKQLSEWKLAELIDVATSLGVLGDDVKKFSHGLRDFRNYIHPNEQVSRQFSPDQNTVDICWHVFKAAFAQLKVNS